MATGQADGDAMHNDGTDPRIRSATSYWIECTVCGPDAETKPPRFPTETALWVNFLSPWSDGWVRLDDGRILCPAHRRIARCDAEGHDLLPWTRHPLDDELEWRYCIHCGAGFEQRIVQSSERVDR